MRPCLPRNQAGTRAGCSQGRNGECRLPRSTSDLPNQRGYAGMGTAPASAADRPIRGGRLYLAVCTLPLVGRASRRAVAEAAAGFPALVQGDGCTLFCRAAFRRTILSRVCLASGQGGKVASCPFRHAGLSPFGGGVSICPRPRRPQPALPGAATLDGLGQSGQVIEPTVGVVLRSERALGRVWEPGVLELEQGAVGLRV
jgi:hypothetical protein